MENFSLDQQPKDTERTTTATELNNIASFHSFAKNSNSNNNTGDDGVCLVATPKDIVLVCGFEGFEDYQYFLFLDYTVVGQNKSWADSKKKYSIDKTVDKVYKVLIGFSFLFFK